MDSLFDIQYEVGSAVRDHLTGNHRTLWDELVESSRRINAVGCDGILMREVQSHTERLLSKMSDEEMRRFWLDTENGIMAVEQGFDEPDRWEMVHDIALDVNQAIADDVCQEAQRALKKKRSKRENSYVPLGPQRCHQAKVDSES